jgi:ABC-type Fe3+ transport system substrate-binding protein
MGAAPIIVAYESYLIAYSLEHQSTASQQYLRDNVRTLYPKPTVWTTQPMIAFSAEGERFMNALLDPEIQRIGWELYGFRPGRVSEPIDLSVVNLPGVPETFDSVVHMPKPAVMDQLIQGIQATPTDAIKQETVNENI